MKITLILSALVCVCISTNTLAQSMSQISSSTPNIEHIGTWKLISQKVTYNNGNVFIGDSTSVFQRKILTPSTFAVIIEKRIPDYDHKKLATSVAGGHYTLVNGDYEELTEYASFKGFDTMKVLYKLTIEDGKLHTVGTVGESTIYDELYVREE